MLTLALPPPPVSARVEYSINGAEGEIRSVARTPMHDEKGDAWSMPLAVVPPFSVEASPATQIILGGNESLGTVQRCGSHNGGSWQRHSSSRSAAGMEDRAAVGKCCASHEPGQHAADFKELPDGAKESRYEVRALLNAGGRDYSEGYSLVARPDLAASSTTSRRCSAPASSTSKFRRD